MTKIQMDQSKESREVQCDWQDIIISKFQMKYVSWGRKSKYIKKVPLQTILKMADLVKHFWKLNIFWLILALFSDCLGSLQNVA